VVAGRLATTKRSVLLLGLARSAIDDLPQPPRPALRRPRGRGLFLSERLVWALHSTSGRVPFRPELSKRSVASAADDREDTCKGGSPAA